MPKKQVLDPATAALYFNLAAGEKEHLTFQEQQLLTHCMDAAFPSLKKEARRLAKKMPVQKKPKQPTEKKKIEAIIGVIILIIAIFLLIATLLTSCDSMQLSHPEDYLKHPGAGWRGREQIEEIDLAPARDYYYFLLHEWEGLYWRGPTRTYKDIDTLGERS